MTLEEKWKWFEDNNPWYRITDDDISLTRFTDFGWINLGDNSVAIEAITDYVINSWDSEYEESDSALENYFLNWKDPTEKENVMFEMLFGVKLPWSEGHPLKFPE